MSIKLITDVWGVRRFKGADRMVLLALADFADHDGTNIFPSNAKIIGKTGLSERQVRRSLRVLEHDGVLVPLSGAVTDLRRYRIDASLIPDDADDRGQLVRPDSMAGRGGHDDREEGPACPGGGAKMAATHKRLVKIPTKITVMDPSSIPAKTLAEVIPMDQVAIAIEAYNEVAKQCPPVTGMVVCKQRTAARDNAIKARLAEVGLAGWREAMAKALESNFVSGRSERGRGHENFRVDIAWIGKAENFAKLIEGKYDGNRRRAGSLEETRDSLINWMRDRGEA